MGCNFVLYDSVCACVSVCVCILYVRERERERDTRLRNAIFISISHTIVLHGMMEPNQNHNNKQTQPQPQPTHNHAKKNRINTRPSSLTMGRSCRSRERTEKISCGHSGFGPYAQERRRRACRALSYQSGKDGLFPFV